MGKEEKLNVKRKRDQDGSKFSGKQVAKKAKFEPIRTRSSKLKSTVKVVTMASPKQTQQKKQISSPRKLAKLNKKEGIKKWLVKIKMQQ